MQGQWDKEYRGFGSTYKDNNGQRVANCRKQVNLIKFRAKWDQLFSN